MKKFISAVALSAILATTVSSTFAGVILSDAAQPPQNCNETNGVILSDFNSFVGSIFATFGGVILSDVVEKKPTQCGDHERNGVILSD